MFYFNLAKNNIKKNSRVYSPYLIITSFIVLVAYIMQSVRNNSGIDSLVGSVNIKNMLGLGNLVTAIFSVIFLFYINSFIMKKRKTELGLYNVLGLDKKHIIKIQKMSFFEVNYGANLFVLYILPVNMIPHMQP